MELEPRDSAPLHLHPLLLPGTGATVLHPTGLRHRANRLPSVRQGGQNRTQRALCKHELQLFQHKSHGIPRVKTLRWLHARTEKKMRIPYLGTLPHAAQFTAGSDHTRLLSPQEALASTGPLRSPAGSSTPQVTPQSFSSKRLPPGYLLCVPSSRLNPPTTPPPPVISFYASASSAIIHLFALFTFPSPI